ncbi:DUF6880 family protein [Sulfurimonas sp.]
MAKQITLEEILALEHNKLCNVLYGMIDTNHTLYDKLEKMILSTDYRALAKQIKKEIKSLEKRRKFITYKNSFLLSKEIWDIVENIETFLICNGHEITASELLRMLILTDTSVYDRTDDSAGVVGDAYRYAEETWVESIKYMDDENIYIQVMELLMTDKYGCRDVLTEDLPQSVLKKIYDTYYTSYGSHIDDEEYMKYSIMDILYKCAHYMGSPKDYMKASLLLNNSQLDDDALFAIAKEYQYIDDVENVIDILQKIESLSRHKLSEFFQMKIWTFDKQGNNTDKVAVYKEFYEKTKEVGVLLKYLEHIEDKVLREKEREKVLLEVKDFSFVEAMHFYKSLDEKELCAEYIHNTQHTLKTSSLHTTELKALLKWLREDFPQETILLLRDICESSLATKQSKYYGSSIWALTEMFKVEEENDTLSWAIEENDEYIERLLKIHKNKRAFMSLYNEAFE